jgi:hypothetical protein
MDSSQLVQQDEPLAHEPSKMPSDVSVTLLLTIMCMNDNLGAMLYWRSLTGLRILPALHLDFQQHHTESLEQFNDEIKPSIRIGMSLGEVVFFIRPISPLAYNSLIARPLC